MIIMYTNPGVTRTTFVLFGFSYLAVGRSYWRLFKKRVVQTKLDIYVFMFTCDILIFCLDTTCTRKTVSDCCGRLPMMMSEGKASKFEFIYLRIFLCGDKNYNNYSNILIISWQSAIPEENHRLATSLCQSLSHNVVSSTPRMSGIPTHNVCCDSHWLHRKLWIQLPYMITAYKAHIRIITRSYTNEDKIHRNWL